MDDDLLKHYNKELAYLRHGAAAFAQAHPKVAGRLRLGPDSVEDPHVGRLIEAVAFLNARIRKKLDDDFPEISTAMLQVLYPHYLAPIPSMSIVQFQGLPELTGAYTLPAGATVETEAVEGEPCRFRTIYPVTLWPLTITQANYMGGAYHAPTIARQYGATSVLRMRLRALAADTTLTHLAPNRLRLFLRGLGVDVHALYTLLMNHTVRVAVADGPADRTPHWLEPTVIKPVGFGLDEGLLPYPARSAQGYRLLTEFFVFPEKFLFFDLDLETVWQRRGEGPGSGSTPGSEIDIYFYFDSGFPELERAVNAQTFALGCTPMVNLYSQRAEPNALDPAHEEVHVVPDVRRPLCKEIYSIDRVHATTADGREMGYRPFYGLEHDSGRHDGGYWLASRRRVVAAEGRGTTDRGTEVYLSVLNLDGRTPPNDDWVLEVQTTCLNRDLPARLPFGGGQPRLQLGEGTGPFASIQCLTAPTPTRRAHLADPPLWRLIAHLNLNVVSLLEAGGEPLRELLRLHNFDDSPAGRAMIDGVVKISGQLVVARIKAAGVSVPARGVEITLTLDEERYAGQGLYLFASVLERFFALYAPLNSFTRLVLMTSRRETPLKRWPPRTGEKLLV